MKILYVATDYPKKGRPTTGFPNYLYRVSLALVQMGHEPVILAVGERDGFRKEQGIEIWTIGVKSIKVKSQAMSYIVNALKKSYMLNNKIEEMVKKSKIDIIQFTSLEGIAILYKGKIPAVLRLSSYAKTYFGSFQTFHHSTVRAMAFMERMSAYKCDAVFAPCKITAEAFEKDIKRRVKIIETPFINDVQEYDNSHYERWLSDKKYVLFFGSIYVEKGILVIAQILEKFLFENQQYYFVFVGDACKINNENSACLLKRMGGKHKDRVIVLRALPHKQLYPIIKGADFVVLPSLMDNFPNACIEAMYFGKIVIGTEGASFEQLITHGKNGLLCKIGDSFDLLEKMQIVVLMDDIEKARMEKSAKERVNRLKPNYTVNKLIRLYESMKR